MQVIDDLIAQTRYSEALKIVNEALLSDSKNNALLMRQANLNFFLGNFQTALKSINEAIENGHSTSWAYARKGLILYELSFFKDAIIWLQKAISLGLSYYEVFFAYAMSLYQLKEYTKSREYFQKSLEMNPNVIFRDWGIESPSVRQILQIRLQKWLKKKDPNYAELVSLLNKETCKHYTLSKGIYSPKTYCITSSFHGLKLSDFSSRVVIKPEDGYDSKGVFVIENGIDLFTLKKIPDDLSLFLENEVARYCIAHNKRVIIEELINDVDFKDDPYLKIPRDFKVFAAGGEVFFIAVYNRNAKKGLRSLVEYTANWQRAPRMTTSYLPGVIEKKPKFFDEMIDLAKSISKEFPSVLRLDFYLSEKGPVFGEFTPNPSGGYNLTEVGERTLQQLFFVYPDKYSV